MYNQPGIDYFYVEGIPVLRDDYLCPVEKSAYAFYEFAIVAVPTSLF
jgi:hypothetical protein